MTTTTFTDRVGLEERTLAHLKEHRKELEARGLNVAYWIARIEAAIEALKVADDRQESLKAELKASTTSVNGLDRAAYVLTSGAIDATVAAWGKDSEQGVILARSRSKVHRRDSTAEVLPVAPPPA